jgi:hypothetical protein
VDDGTTSQVMTMTVRAAGEVPGEIHLRGIGGQRPFAHLHIGALLFTTTRPHVTLQHVHRAWNTAAVLAKSLPRRLDPAHSGLSGDNQVSGVVRLAARPVCTANLMPARLPAGPPQHLLISIGPVLIQLLDQLAYRSIGDLWRTATIMLHAPEQRPKR